MNCTDSRALVEKMHGKILGTSVSSKRDHYMIERHFEDVTEHMEQCDDCKKWFEGTLCPRVKGLLGEMGSDDYVMHRTTHDILELSWVESDH